MRSLLTFGVNETARALEKDTISLLFICRYDHEASFSSTILVGCRQPLASFCLRLASLWRPSRTYQSARVRDVKPIRVVDHLATCARVHQVPFVVLPKATIPLGQAFGMQRMACLGIRRHSTTTTQQGGHSHQAAGGGGERKGPIGAC
jgi:ribosomal protein L7Ae-like RNA K-turn-binding protein